MTSIPDLAPMQEALLGAPDPHIVTLEARIRAAQLGADVAALDQLLSEDLLLTGPDGQLGTKADDLAAHGSGTVRFCAHEPEELRVRRIGAHVAVSALRARLTVDVAGARLQGTFLYTRVWAQEDDGAWRVVGGHVSLVPRQRRQIPLRLRSNFTGLPTGCRRWRGAAICALVGSARSRMGGRSAQRSCRAIPITTPADVWTARGGG